MLNLEIDVDFGSGEKQQYKPGFQVVSGIEGTPIETGAPPVSLAVYEGRFYTSFDHYWSLG
ncbi:hypothetical protein [Endozoicomonas elysicola]|uniref:Uncharacterized protein n=1 Tax=Endozoicomonas elysicola TaxID=305900 RepID=A0A081KAW6_9GAMM|nr:hypothetical protein [Endozoicomonas elysicola]KEI71292.1 hypothetical protein GV64_11575 [Endozoicomonas elysicola]